MINQILNHYKKDQIILKNVLIVNIKYLKMSIIRNKLNFKKMKY